MPDVEKKSVQHFIDGEFVDSADGATFESISPIDNEVVADVALGGAEDVDRAVRAARRAFEEGPWPRMSAAERGAILYRLADLLEANRDEVANWETLDTGKPIMASSTRDIHGTTERFRFFADYAKQSLDHGDHFDNLETNQSTIVVKEPVGVVGAIAPWNLPLPMMGWKLGPALAFGNTVVAKPSEDSPITTSLLAEMFAEAGLPDGVVNVVNGFGPASAGGAIVDHPGVDAITFTGSGTAGRAIMAAAAPTLKKVALELGGKSANIFFADADLSKAVPGSGMAIFGNSGQMCIACSRMFVQRPIYDQVVEMTAAMAEKLPIGDPRDPATVMGPVINTEAVERIQRYIEFSNEDGARLVAGGYKLDGEFAAGNFIKPTVFADATNDMRSCRDEIFGPVQHIISFDTEEEALKMANDCDYGLGGAVWTTDLGKANRVSRSMRTGFVWVNGYARHDDRAPFGGYKQSGIGREGGKYSEEFFTEQKGIEFTY
ncbi:MAG: aldehyde dehydrogenase family protein [Acidimicrobiaceae bacterium]|nr:aldehyde dehydrogenase family protein [Acidimicrobiaceae bacterium]